MAKSCGYKKGGMVMDGEPDMDAPGLYDEGMGGLKDGGMKAGKVLGAGEHKGQKGAGAMHGHQEMSGKALNHKPMPVGTKHGHKAM